MSVWNKNSARTSGAGFRASSISQVAKDELSSGCTSSLDLMSVPRLVERSPSLVKASMAVAASAAVKGRALPCLLALHGTRQTPQRHHYSTRVTSSAAVVDDSTDVCLRPGDSRPPLRVIIRRRQENTVGYSARLKMIDCQEFADVEKDTRGSCLSNIDGSKVGEPPGVYGIPLKVIRCGSSSCTYDPYLQNESQPCRTSSTTEVTGPVLKGGVHKDHQHITLDSPPKAGKVRRLRGLLCKGSVTWPRPDNNHDCDPGERDAAASPPQIPLLILGQGQKPDPRMRLNSSRCVSSGINRRTSVRLVSPRETLLATARKAVEHKRRSSFSPDRWSNHDGDLATLPWQGEGSMRLDADEDVDVATVDSTDGEGEDAGRWVLRVTVPRPPPTSLLILRSPPQPRNDPT